MPYAGCSLSGPLLDLFLSLGLISTEVLNIIRVHLHRKKQRRNIESLEEDLGGLLPVPARVERRFRQQHRVLFAERLQLVLAVDVLPDPLHVVPVRHDAVLHRITDGQKPAVFLGFGSDEEVAFEGSGHDPGVFRSADEVRKVAFRNLVSGESGLDDAGPVVDDDRLVDDQVVLFHDG